MAITPLELVCFGSPTARLAGAEPPAEVRWRKHLALLIYLALSPSRSRSRDHLLGLLWADQPEGGARKALNQAVLRLRHALGEERLRSESDALSLSGDNLEVDALRFMKQAQTAPEDVLPLLRGDFLEGFHVDGAQEFEDWMGRERERYGALAASTLVSAGERRYAEGRLAEAADAARRALALAPRSEPAVRVLMRAAALGGDAATALAAYHDFAARLKDAVGEQPGRALTTLADRIRSETWRPAGGATPTEVPLVGRAQTHRTAFESVAHGLAQGPHALVIVGPPGMGRSRLLSECARRLALDGALLLRVRPVASDHDAPWSTLRQLVHAGLGDAPGLPAAGPQALAALAGLAPELTDRFAPREVRDVADMAAALADVLRAITDERPVGIALDDAHWSDGASIAALGAAIGSLKQSPLVLMVTIAEGVGDPPRELLRLQSDIGRALPGVPVQLRALDESDLATLVGLSAPWCRDDTERDRLTRRLALETGGSPLFAVTLLDALATATSFQRDWVAWPPPDGTYDASLPFSVPSQLRVAIELRLGELSPPDLNVLRIASVCGEAIDAELVAQVVGCRVDDVERALPAFERRHLVQFDGRRHTFATPLISEVVRTACLTRGERQRLERQAAEALAPRTDLEGRILRAELLAHGAPDQAAYDLALAVGWEAVEGGGRRIVQRAIAAAERSSREAHLDRTKLDELRARV